MREEEEEEEGMKLSLVTSTAKVVFTTHVT